MVTTDLSHTHTNTDRKRHFLRCPINITPQEHTRMIDLVVVSRRTKDTSEMINITIRGEGNRTSVSERYFGDSKTLKG